MHEPRTVSDAQTTHGSLEHAPDGRPRLRFARTVPHPVEKVWRAITEPEHLAHWFPTTIEGERAAGARLRFEFPKGELEGFDGEMLAFEPPKLMEFRWGGDILRLELEPQGQGTALTLLDTLEQLGKAARDAAGWHTCLDALSAYVDGDARAPDAMAAWSQVHPSYVETFGADAATIGPPEGLA